VKRLPLRHEGAKEEKKKAIILIAVSRRTQRFSLRTQREVIAGKTERKK